MIASLLIGLMLVVIRYHSLPFTRENILGVIFTAICWPVVLAMTIVELFKTND
jgi:hypothetical protein